MRHGVARQTISIVMPTRNVAPILRRALDALAWADEIVIVDSFSTDETPEVARSYPNVRFYQWVRPEGYSIYAKVNYGIDRASGDWIMRLDSDEVVTPALAREIEEVLEDPRCPYDGFYVPSRTYFFGRWIRYGIAYNTRGINRTTPGHGYRKCLFRRGRARYPDHHVHEEMESTGDWGYLQCHYDHFSHATVSQWIEKMNRYTDIDTARWGFDDPMFRRYHPWKTLAAVSLLFFDHFVRKKGYRDGMHGFMLAGLNAVYLFVERCKMWERLWMQEQRSRSGEMPSTGPGEPPERE
jgi:glycosyltransferase involved in cell wall biosynthesis